VRLRGASATTCEHIPQSRGAGIPAGIVRRFLRDSVLRRCRHPCRHVRRSCLQGSGPAPTETRDSLRCEAPIQRAVCHRCDGIAAVAGPDGASDVPPEPIINIALPVPLGTAHFLTAPFAVKPKPTDLVWHLQFGLACRAVGRELDGPIVNGTVPPAPHHTLYCVLLIGKLSRVPIIAI